MLPNTLPSIHNRYRMSAELDNLAEFSPEWWVKLLKMYGIERPLGTTLRQHVLDAFAVDPGYNVVVEFTGGERVGFFGPTATKVSRLWWDVAYSSSPAFGGSAIRVSSMSRTGAGLVVRTLAAVTYLPQPVNLGPCKYMLGELHGAAEGTDWNDYFDDILPLHEGVRQSSDYTEPTAGKCSQCAGRGHHLFLFSTPTCGGCGGTGRASETIRLGVCETCNGEGYVEQEPQPGCAVETEPRCPDCDGSGWV